jgi:hypothetical protein
MVYLHTKNTNLDILWLALGWEMLVYFVVICYIGMHSSVFVYFVVIWFIFHRFGIHILWSFGTFSIVLVYCAKKNLTTLMQTQQ